MLLHLRTTKIVAFKNKTPIQVIQCEDDPHNLHALTPIPTSPQMRIFLIQNLGKDLVLSLKINLVVQNNFYLNLKKRKEDKQ